MPRIYDAASNPLDFCKKHFPNEAVALKKYGDNGRENNQGPDGRGNCFDYDSEHPPYTDDPDMYRCYVCKRILTDEDSYV